MRGAIAIFAVAVLLAGVLGISGIGGGYSGSYTVEDDTVPPEVISVSPGNGEKNVGPSSNIVISFSEAMDESSTEGAFSISPSVSGNFSWNDAGDTMTFIPDDLSPNTTYRVRIDGTVAKDLAGNLLDGNGDGVHNPSDTWYSMSSMPTARSGLAAASVDGKIYAIGGWDHDSGRYFSTVEMYDPQTDSWTAKASMSVARRGLMAVSLDGLIYAIGGRDSGGNTLSLVEVYDPASDSWSTVSQLPEPKSYGAAAVVNGKIYVVGGSGDSSFEYDPENDEWTAISSIPTQRTDLTSQSASGRLYAIGGSDSYGNALSKDEEFDPVDGVWGSKSDMPTARWDPASAEVSGKIYVLGGADSSDYLSINEMYIPNDDYTWYFTTGYETPSHNTTPPHILSVSPTDGSETGGMVDITVMFSAEMNRSATESAFSICPSVNGTFSWNSAGDSLTFHPDSALSDGTYRVYIDGTVAKDINGTYLDGNGNGKNDVANSWDTASGMPTARSALGAAAIGHNIYAVGGRSGSRLSILEIYNTESDSWTTGASMHVARSGPGVVALNGRIYAIGGEDDNGVLNTVEEYDPNTDTWAIKNPMPTPRRGLSVVAFNNRIYAIGGYDNDSHWLHAVEEYDPANDTWAIKSNITYGHAYGVAAEINGKIYITSWNTTEVYDPSNDTSWLLKSRDVKRMDQTGAAVGGMLYAMGGIDPDNDYSKAVNTNYQYDPCGDRWTQVLSMPTKRWDAASAVVNGKIYVMGGGNSDGTQNVNEVYTPGDDYSWYFSVNTVKITTNAGWNLISLPWQTNPVSIEDALSSINWTKSMVYLNGTWYTYNR